jgi:hypothetical protein
MPRPFQGTGRLPFRNLVTRLLQFPLVADFLFGRELRGEIKLPTMGSDGMAAAMGTLEAEIGGRQAEPGATPDRGRWTGFAQYQGIAGGPGRV